MIEMNQQQMLITVASPVNEKVCICFMLSSIWTVSVVAFQNSVYSSRAAMLYDFFANGLLMAKSLSVLQVVLCEEMGIEHSWNLN